MEDIIITLIVAVATIQISKFYFSYKTFKLNIEAQKQHVADSKTQGTDREE